MSDKFEKIYSTTNFDLFVFKRGNRPVGPRVKRLAEAIQKNNHLKSFPIVCRHLRKRLEVLDGQHRLEAARMLGVPIYYIIDGDMSLQEIISANTLMKQWVSLDYIEAYAAKGITDYIALRDFREQTKLPVTSCVMLLSGRNCSGPQLQDFRAGKFKINDIDHAYETADIIIRLVSAGHAWAKHRSCVNAMSRIISLPNIDVDRLRHKIDVRSGMLRQQVDSGQYVDMFDEVYNYKCPKRDLLSLKMELRKQTGNIEE